MGVAAYNSGLEDGMRKHAILGTALLAGGLHAATNLGMKIFRGSRAGHGFEADAMAAGLRRGMAGKNLGHVTRDIATFGVGPEALVTHDIGRRLGERLQLLSGPRQHKLLKKIRKSIASNEHLRNSPISGPMVGAANRLLSGRETLLDRLPSVAAGEKRGLGSRAASLGLAAATVAAEPHTALHLGINATRRAIARSDTGKRFLLNQMRRGVEGKKLHRGLELATDLAVSPGALDTRRLGTALRAHAESRGYSVPSTLPSLDDLVDKVTGHRTYSK